MKKFIINFFTFLLPLVLILLFIEYNLSLVPNSYNVKRNFFEEKINKIDVLVVGSSISLYGINPAYFSHTGFNLANVSQTEFYDKRLTLKYIDKIPNLKLVIIPIGYSGLYSQLHDSKEDWRDYFYYHFWNIRYKDLPLFDARRYSYIALYSLDVTKKYIRSHFKPLEKMGDICNEYGYAPNDSAGKNTRISDISGRARALSHTQGYINQVKKNEMQFIIDDLDGFLADLRGRHIKVVFITPPVYHTYSEYCNKQILAINDSVIHSLSEKYNAPYYNYFSDPRFTIDDFADNDHLCTNGATRFSNIINNDIIIPSLNNSPLGN